MAETKASILKIATANTISSLDPVMTRRGRWDEVFSVDIPGLSERAELFRVHLRKVGRDPGHFDIDRLSKTAVDFCGAEVESVIQGAMYTAFDARIDMTTEHILVACSQVSPIARTDARALEEFRRSMKGRAVPVNYEMETRPMKMKSVRAL